MKDHRDFFPAESELAHYERCNDGVITMESAHRLVRMIRKLQKQLKKGGLEI